MENKLLSFVEFKDVVFWSVAFYRDDKNLFNEKFKKVRLINVLTPNRNIIEIKDDVKYTRITVKVSSNGVVLRDVVFGNEIGTKRQFLTKAGQFILSKIDARNGAFGIIPKELENAIVTNDFPLFDVSESLNTQFLYLLCKTKMFIDFAKTCSSGTTNRQRIDVSKFLNFQIPLPSLDEQELIVSAYQSKIDEAQQLENEAQQLENEIEKYLFEELGIEQEQQKKGKIRGLQFVEFKNVEKWGVDFVFNMEKEKNKYKVYKISDLCKISSGGTPSRSRKEYFTGNIPWIKTGELNNEILFDTEEKITEDAIQNSSARLYPIGSLVVAMYGATIGKTAKLGVEATTNQACAVLFDIDTSKVEIDFLWEFIQSQTNRFKSLAYGSAQPNLNAGIISNYKVPLPALDTQNKIVEQIKTMKQTQKHKTETATRLRAEALAEFEQVIFS